MTFSEQIRQKSEEYDIPRKAHELSEHVDAYVAQAVGKVGDLTHKNRGTIEGFLEKAAKTVNDKTEGKYADKVAKAKDAAHKGVGKLVEQRPEAKHAATTDQWREATTTEAPTPPETDAG